MQRSFSTTRVWAFKSQAAQHADATDLEPAVRLPRH